MHSAKGHVYIVYNSSQHTQTTYRYQPSRGRRRRYLALRQVLSLALFLMPHLLKSPRRSSVLILDPMYSSTKHSTRRSELVSPTLVRGALNTVPGVLLTSHPCSRFPRMAAEFRMRRTRHSPQTRRSTGYLHESGPTQTSFQHRTGGDVCGCLFIMNS